MTSAALLEEFLRHLRVERGLAENSWLTYRYQLAGYLRFLEGRGRDVLSATRDDVVAYLEEKKNGSLKASTLFTAAVAVRQFHGFLVAKGLAPADPTAGMKLPKFKQQLPNPLSEEEIRRLLDRPGYKFRDIRNLAMLEVLYATGLRVSELTGLIAEQLNLKDGWIRVFGKGAKERMVPIGPRATAAILRYLETKTTRFPAAQGPLFVSVRGRPLGRGAFWSALRKMGQAAQLAARVFPHRIRHSAATSLLEGGMDLRVLQEMLGHSAITTTQIYAHVRAEHLKESYRKAHPRF